MEDYISTCGWTKIYDQRLQQDWMNLEKQGPSAHNHNAGTLPVLEVVGERIKPKQERWQRRLDKMQLAPSAALKIQALFRGRMARSEVKAIRAGNAATLLQRQARVMLMRLRLEQVRRSKAATKIQSIWRMKQAREQLNALKLKKADQRRWEAAIKLQSIRRMVQAIALREKLKRNQCALTL